ncbi:HAL/PAL/TAL family ammonia-lyase [Motilimonas cestriensis]|uniref:HAL/PAL/TAL family ammonia-lyase n=1 Tax=Motilimonas cestriensis TaxID=2742685 RepID=UPI003DA2F375
MTPSPILFGEQPITIEQVVQLAQSQGQVQLSKQTSFISKINQGCQFLDRLLAEDGVIYGVTTGYGDSCTVTIPPHLVTELPMHLTRFHGCGLGKNLTPIQARAVMVARLNSLTQGASGVSMALLEQLVAFINLDLVPRIPEEGSVGASGDLTPLSYLAGALIGEREVYYQGQLMAAKQAMTLAGIRPHTLRPKEGLALMNGTAVMTALACIAFDRARYLAKLASRITAMASVALKGNAFHFDEKLFAVKPHPGQAQIASWIRSDLEHLDMPRNSDRLQDRYSLRCAPHVIGVLQDALPFLRQFIETELNSANDNPIIDGVDEHVLHGGHFYGGHIAFAMDSLKNAVANIADLLDRQLALLMDTKFNNGLPANLSGASAERSMINHGFKAVQIGASAWTAEALKLTMPASVFSRSTECHNQDKVSMGTIAARDCLRVLELTEQVTAASLLAVSQGISLRNSQGELTPQQLTPALAQFKDRIFEQFEFVSEDRPLEDDLRRTLSQIQQKHWELYGDR